jgi:hypothetical protein
MRCALRTAGALSRPYELSARNGRIHRDGRHARYSKCAASERESVVFVVINSPKRYRLPHVGRS